jgi:hypothetical protein
MRLSSMVFALVAAGAAIPALAQSLTATPTRASARGEPVPVIVTGDRLICRPVSRTGTRLAVSARCLSRDEWVRARGSVATHQYRSIEEATQALAVIGRASTTGCGSTPP